MIKFHHLLRLGSTLWSGFKAELSDALGLRSQKVTLPVTCFVIYYYYYSMPMRKHIHVYMPMYAHTHLPRHSSLAGVRSFQFDLQREKLLVSLYSLLIFFLPLNIFLFLFSLVELFFVIFSSDSNALSLFQGTLQAWNVVAARIGNKNNCVLKKDVITLTSEALAAKVVSAVDMN